MLETNAHEDLSESGLKSRTLHYCVVEPENCKSNSKDYETANLTVRSVSRLTQFLINVINNADHQIEYDRVQEQIDTKREKPSL